MKARTCCSTIFLALLLATGSAQAQPTTIWPQSFDLLAWPTPRTTPLPSRGPDKSWSRFSGPAHR